MILATIFSEIAAVPHFWIRGSLGEYSLGGTRPQRGLPFAESGLTFAYTIIMRGETTNKAGPECLGFTARLLSRVITAVYDDALADVGLKVSQFGVLSAIANREDTRPAELAKFLAMDESTLSRNVARMCARGWLKFESGDDDRRKSYPAWQKAQSQLTQRLGSEGVTALKSIVRKLRS
jgi:DNA-binding MarR family transcriptional regulator